MFLCNRIELILELSIFFLLSIQKRKTISLIPIKLQSQQQQSESALGPTCEAHVRSEEKRTFASQQVRLDELEVH